ncbi:MAG: response regulator receiver [bacterium]|nr:MAG: response regulator receiver [bacterium]KAF0148983.1 MAG: response regulator receiver [bacterium]KAF0168374.1 MAG: response regulator receiver [bacterium]TXT21038.1 MAG: response regulator receiver [bacterium]
MSDLIDTPEPHDTLLIVDDEANILAALARLFRRDGYALLRATSGREALALLATHEVGVILTDQRMPDMSGVQFLAKARERWPDSVRIMLSGYTELSSVTESVNQGAIYKFLTKPWDDEPLRQTVREAFQLHRVTRENTRLNAALREANAALTLWNQELEQRVAEKTREALRHLHVLRAAQEVVAHLPLPVFGIDCDGCLVMANQAAARLLPGASARLGETADELLPTTLFSSMLDAAGKGRGRLADGRGIRFWRYPLGGASASIGTALVIEHVEPE